MTTDPMSDAAVVETWCKDVAPRQLHICFGPDEVIDMFAQRLADLGMKGDGVVRIRLGEDPRKIKGMVLNAAVASKPMEFVQHAHPAIASNPEMLRLLRVTDDIVTRTANRFAISSMSFAKRARQFIGHAIVNAPMHVGSVDLRHALKVDADVVLVVGGGPGIHDAATHEAVKAASRRGAALVIAVDRALPQLADAGVVPDFACTLDVVGVKAPMLRAAQRRMPGTICVVKQQCNPRLAGAWRGMHAMVRAAIPAVTDHLPEVVAIPDEAMSVGSLALQLARMIGPRVVGLVAMEFNGRGLPPPPNGYPRATMEGGRAVVGPGLDALIENVEADIEACAGDGVAVWNWSLPSGLDLLGAQRPLCALQDLRGERGHVPVVPLAADADAIRAGLDRLDDVDQRMLDTVLYDQRYERGGANYTDDEVTAARRFVHRCTAAARKRMTA